MTETPAVEPVSERMQALLSRAVEEQVSEQRAASSVLHDLKEQLAALEAGVRSAAANDTVARLDNAVSTVVADQRTATTLLSQRLEALTSRVEALSALGGDVSNQAAALTRVQSTLETFSSFPGALSALQHDVSGLHDRLAPLADVQAAVGDLGVRAAGEADALGPQLRALEAKLVGLGTPDVDRLRDAVVDALSIRLERLQQAAERPVVGPEVLKSDLGDLRASISTAVGNQLDPLREAITDLEGRLDRLGERVGAVGGAADGVPALATDLAAMGERLEAVQGLKAQLDALSADVRVIRSNEGATAVRASVEGLSETVQHLSDQVAKVPALSVDDIAAQVSARVADRLVETLAPRIADVVLTRVSAALVGQLAEALAPQVQAQALPVVREANAESEARLLAHLDEGLVTLAETLLRRKTPVRGTAKAAPAEPVPVPAEPVAEVMEQLTSEPPAAVEAPAPAKPVAAAKAESDSRPAVTTGLAPAPTPTGPPAARAPESKAPESRAPESRAPERKPAETPAKAAAKAAPKSAPTSATKPAAKPKPAAKKAAKPAAKKAPSRPLRPSLEKPVSDTSLKPASPIKKATPRPQPLLERTPEPNGGHDAEPAPVRPPAPLTPPPPPPSSTVLPPPPPAPPASAKRKAWWRPGG